MKSDTMRRVMAYKKGALARRHTREYQKTQLKHLIQANKRKRPMR